MTIAIDPGASGGIAWTDRDGIAQAAPMPDGMTAQVDFLRALRAELPTAGAVMERVGGYRPGNSGPAAVTFARHCGNLEAALYSLGVPTICVTPRKWQAALGTWPDEKADRKRAIRDAMARRYPHLHVTLGTADALGMLTWAYGRTAATEGGKT
jgi:hypothetical protein